MAAPSEKKVKDFNQQDRRSKLSGRPTPKAVTKASAFYTPANKSLLK